MEIHCLSSTDAQCGPFLCHTITQYSPSLSIRITSSLLEIYICIIVRVFHLQNKDNIIITIEVDIKKNMVQNEDNVTISIALDIKTIN